MDSTDERIERAKKKAKRILIWVIAAAALLFLAAFLLYRFTDLIILMPEPSEVSYDFRCDGRDIQHLEDGEWTDFTVSGVELAKSQKDADYETYARWLTGIRDMNANAVRVHALMPPDFYRALYDLNQSGETLWLIQGVELEDEVFANMTDMRSGNMTGLFRKEGRLVIDAVHGNKSTRGYSCDVSDYTMAYILGDKWDPDLVLYTDRVAADIAGSFSGNYAAVWETGFASTTYIAEVFDDLFAYETHKYAQQHIIGFGNSQSTDMLFHDLSWAVGLNENIAQVYTGHIATTGRVRTGVFAACRVDTGVMQNMSFDPDYIEYKDPEGRRNPVRYYLDALYNSHRIPMLLGGTTISAARGVSGLDELFGYDRGGVGEEIQSEGLCFVYSQAVEAGFCGGFVGYYLDDATNTAWNTEKFASHNGNWLDAQDSEQSLGIVALEPDSEYCVDGDVSEWQGAKTLVDDGGVLMQAAGDEKYLYLHLSIDDYDGQRDVVYVPIDVTPLSGAAKDESQKLTFDRYADFLLSINGKKRAKLEVHKYYSTIELFDQELEYDYWFNSPPKKDEGDFVDVEQYVRPKLYATSGENIDAVTQDAGLLRYGSSDSRSEDYNSLADYYIKGSEIELRIPWALLNFTDPSTGRIMGDFYTGGNKSIEISNIYTGLSLYRDDKMKQYQSKEFYLPRFGENVYRERARKAYYGLSELFGKIGQ